MNPIGRPRKNFDYPSYMGGYTQLNAYGHVWEYLPSHPASSKAGYVLQHRLIMEAHLGRYLSGTEIVHHIDENKTNNSIENLMLLPSRSAHRALHNQLRRKNLGEERVREALQGHTTKEAAAILGVHPQTLYNNYDHLLTKRRLPHNPEDPETVNLVRVAASEGNGIRTFAKETGISAQVVKKICEMNEITWVPKCRKGYKWKRKNANQTQ